MTKQKQGKLGCVEEGIQRFTFLLEQLHEKEQRKMWSIGNNSVLFSALRLSLTLHRVSAGDGGVTLK
jgi:hypothetical protein